MRKLRYYPELNKVTGGITSTLLMLQLEYWFEKTDGNAFFKFLEPCEDVHYKTGDSWCEELGFSKSEFRTAFSKIGKVYKSKKEFNESKDKFEGKLYLSYFDRIKRMTFYIRNKELVEASFVFGESKKEISRSEEANPPISVETLTEYLPHYQKSQVPYEMVIDSYHEICEDLPRVDEVSYWLKRRLGSIWGWVGGSLEKIREVFVKTQESDFLSGRIAHKGWRASLEWILQKDKFEAILKGKYAVNFGEAKCPKIDKASAVDICKEAVERTKRKNRGSRFTKIASHNWDFEVLEALEEEYIEGKLKDYKGLKSPLLEKIKKMQQ